MNILGYLVLCLLGMYVATYQSTLPLLAAEFLLSEWAVGISVSVHFAGAFFVPLLLGRLTRQMGEKRLLLASLLLFLLGILCLVMAAYPALLWIGAGLVGGSSSLLEGGFSNLLSHHNPHREYRVLSRSQMFYCIGAAISPLIYLAIQRISANWRTLYLISAGLALVCFVLLLLLPIPTVVPAAPSLKKEKRSDWSELLCSPVYYLLLAAMFLYVGVESSIPFWSGSFFAEHLTLSSSYLLSLYWFGMAIGRFVTSFLREDKSTGTFTLLFLASAVVMFLTILLFPTSAVILIGYFITGFGFASVWPYIVSLTTVIFSKKSATAVGGQMSVAAMAGMVFPFLISWLMSRYSTQHAVFALVIAQGLLVGFLLALRKFSQAQELQ